MPADGYSMKLDASEWDAGLRALGGPVKESLARRMLVTGGTFMRDKAKVAAARSDPPYNPSSRGSHQSGTLADSIYLAYDAAGSTGSLFKYGVSWNARKAWWGKLIEFGYIRTHRVGRDAQGNFYTDMSQPLPVPKVVKAKPFLRPTIDAHSQAALQLMIERGRKELPLLLAEIAK